VVGDEITDTVYYGKLFRKAALTVSSAVHNYPTTSRICTRRLIIECKNELGFSKHIVISQHAFTWALMEKWPEKLESIKIRVNYHPFNGTVAYYFDIFPLLILTPFAFL